MIALVGKPEKGNVCQGCNSLESNEPRTRLHNKPHMLTSTPIPEEAQNNNLKNASTM